MASIAFEGDVNLTTTVNMSREESKTSSFSIEPNGYKSGWRSSSVENSSLGKLETKIVDMGWGAVAALESSDETMEAVDGGWIRFEAS